MGEQRSSGNASQTRQPEIPQKMKALQYSAAEKFAVVEIDVPEIGDDDVLLKITAVGICGTDLHYHKGESLTKNWPFIPGHETVGNIAAIGKNVKNVVVGDRVAADPLEACSTCFHCIRRKPLLCADIIGYGGNAPGGCAQYTRYPSKQVYPIGDLPDLEAVLVEPAACAVHGIERMNIPVGSRVLLFGCGPTGNLLAQLICMNGGAHLTIASKGGSKLDTAKKLNIADEYIEISEFQAHVEMDALRTANPHGFDVVIEATGAPSVLEASINYVRKGGTLVVYGVYDESVKISWSPFQIWENEMTIVASYCSMGHMPHAMEYIKAGKLNLKGIVNKTYTIDQWEECLEAVRKQVYVKVAVVFD